MTKEVDAAAVRALFEVATSVTAIVDLMEFGPFMMTDEQKAEDFGLDVLRRLRDLRTVALKRSREIAKAAGVPSPAVVSSLEASIEGAFGDLPKGH